MQKIDPVNPKNQAVRLIFEYRGTEVKIVSEQRVRMLPPPPHPLIPRADERGVWLELRDDAGRPLYRRVIENPIRQDIEVVTDDDDRPLGRIPVKRPQGTFSVVVPFIQASRRIALVGDIGRFESGGRRGVQRASVERQLEFELNSTEEAR